MLLVQIYISCLWYFLILLILVNHKHVTLIFHTIQYKSLLVSYNDKVKVRITTPAIHELGPIPSK